MPPVIPDPLLERLSELVHAQLGWHYPRERWRDLVRAAEAVAPELGFEDGASCARGLVAGPLTRRHIDALVSHLTVGETYFLRESRSFEILGHDILARIVESRRDSGRSLRLWSAGCCTGEEAYSLAILLRELLPDIAEWNVTLLATDVNPRFLHKASKGVYGEWSFRGTPQWVRNKYFSKDAKGLWAIDPEVQRMVRFAALNLAEDGYPSATTDTCMMDLILCRNVLMYFAPGAAAGVVRRFHGALADGGWLLLSSSEISHVECPQFQSVDFGGAVFMRKCPEPARPARNPDLDVAPLRAAAAEAQDAKAAAPETADCAAGGAYAEAVSLYERGLYAEVIAKLESCLTAPPAGGAVTALLARACANLGQLERAHDWCTRALAADKLEPGMHYLQASILLEQGELERAASALHRTLYLDPDFVLAHFTLGNLMLRSGKFSESNRCFENAQNLLMHYGQDEVLPESSQITAGRLAAIIGAIQRTETAA
jgi:chemotaxis protein methyltransferase CheR